MELTREQFKEQDLPHSDAGHNPYWCGGDNKGQCCGDDPCWSCIGFLHEEAQEAIALQARLDTIKAIIEKEPCTHPAYCRDEMIWRKEIDKATSDALRAAGQVIRDRIYSYPNVGDGVIHVLDDIRIEVERLNPERIRLQAEMEMLEVRKREAEACRETINALKTEFKGQGLNSLCRAHKCLSKRIDGYDAAIAAVNGQIKGLEGKS